MNRALWLLMGLQCRGWFRSFWRSLRTLKGALLILLGLAVFAPWLWSVLYAPRSAAGFDPNEMRRFGPAVFLLYCVVTVLFSKGERSIYFSPAEVNFLFPGPFTRRQLLAYKISMSVLVGLPTTLLMSLLLRMHARWYPAAFVGLFLAFLFLQLFAMAVNLLVTAVGTRAYTRGRKLLLIAVAAGVAVVLFQAGRAAGPGGGRALFRHIEHTSTWQVIATPLRWFVEAFLVEPWQWLDLAHHAGLAAGVVAVLLLLVFLLDAHYLESAAATSERIYTQLQRMRRGEASSLRWSGGSGKARLSLPSFPWWGGVGPVVWRQTTTAFRSLGRLALLVLVFGPILLGPVMAGGAEMGKEDTALLVVVGVLFWISIILTALVPFDFRGDLDRMEVLKSLPLPAWRLAVGQLLTPVILVSLVQVLVLATVQTAWGRWHPLLTAGMAFTLPFNFLLFGLDNLLFLWFPSRILAGNPGDFQALGRNVLFLVTKMLALSVAGVLAFLVWALVYHLTGQNFVAALAAAWLTLAAFAVGLVPLVALSFNAFDVSRDIPA